MNPPPLPRPSPDLCIPKCGNLCGQKGQEAIPSWGQDVPPRTYLTQMGPFLHPMPPAPPPQGERLIIFKDRACDIDLCLS
jgi:hypothetical protein